MQVFPTCCTDATTVGMFFKIRRPAQAVVPGYEGHHFLHNIVDIAGTENLW